MQAGEENDVQNVIREAMERTLRFGRSETLPGETPPFVKITSAFGFVWQDEAPSTAALEAARFVAAEAAGPWLDPDEDVGGYSYLEALEAMLVFFNDGGLSDVEVFEAMTDAYKRARRERGYRCRNVVYLADA